MLRDQLFNHPASLAAGCLVWVPIAIWILALVHWAIQGDVDVIFALIGIGVGIGLAATALLAKEPYMAPLILIAVIVTTAVFPVVRSALVRRQLDQIDIDAIERAYEMLAQKPANPIAKFRLAKALYHRGLTGHALAIAEESIQQMPEATFPEEHRILKGWRHYRLNADQFSGLDCPECGTSNPPGQVHCRNCGAPFLLLHARGSWIGRSLAAKFITAWACLMIALVGIPLVAGSLPPGVAIPVIVAMMASGIFVVVWTFRNGARKAA